MAIEDLGVRGHRTYAMTERDLVEDNNDLRAFCGRLLKAEPRTALDAEPAPSGGLSVTTAGLDRLDVFVDDRPRDSREVDDGTTDIELPSGWATAELVGYGGGNLRQRRRIRS
jgi:hypothetical protein